MLVSFWCSTNAIRFSVGWGIFLSEPSFPIMMLSLDISKLFILNSLLSAVSVLRISYSLAIPVRSCMRFSTES